MPYLTTYGFDQGNDWSNPGPFRIPALGGEYSVSSPFHSETIEFNDCVSHTVPAYSQWLGVGTAFSVIRQDTEALVLLSDVFNSSTVYNIVTEKFSAHPGASFRPPILTSYALGTTIQGPGAAIGGLPNVQDQYLNKLLLTINVPFHLNTPAGVAAVNGNIVYYVDISLQSGKPKATVIGVAHPWAFEAGLIGAGQDQINQGLDGTVQDTADPNGPVQQYLNVQLGKIEGTYTDLYLLPGIVTRQGTSPWTGDASRDITLALAPNRGVEHGPPPVHLDPSTFA